MGKRRRTIALVAIGGLLCFSGWVYTRLFLLPPKGTGPAGPTVNRAAFENVWTQRSIQVLAIGDSITAGLGAESPSHSYVNRLIDNPPDEYEEMQGLCLNRVLPNLQWINIAVSGSNSLQHENYIADRLEPFDESSFGLVLITTGGNDLIHWYGRSQPSEGAMYGATTEVAEPWIASFSTRLSRMIEAITKLFPGGCEIYLADIYDPTDGVGDAPSIFLPEWEAGLAIHAEYNKIIRACAEQRDNVFHVPLYETFLGHGSHCSQFWRSTYDRQDPTNWFHTNIEDPNDRGYDAIRRVFLNTILENSCLISK